MPCSNMPLKPKVFRDGFMSRIIIKANNLKAILKAIGTASSSLAHNEVVHLVELSPFRFLKATLKRMWKVWKYWSVVAGSCFKDRIIMPPFSKNCSNRTAHLNHVIHFILINCFLNCICHFKFYYTKIKLISQLKYQF